MNKNTLIFNEKRQPIHHKGFNLKIDYFALLFCFYAMNTGKLVLFENSVNEYYPSFVQSK